MPDQDPYKQTFPVLFTAAHNKTSATVNDAAILANASRIPVTLGTADPQGDSFYIGSISSCSSYTGL
jgi:hypothetical protein